MSKNKKPLSLKETKELLGAEEPEDIGKIQHFPFGLMHILQRISRRLKKSRRSQNETKKKA